MSERQIRAIKDMLYKKQEHSDDKQWTSRIKNVLVTYNVKLVNSAGFTPMDAMKKENWLTVKLNLELKRKNNRTYPNIHVGDTVKVYKKTII